MIVSTPQLEQALGITRQRINELARKGKIPRGDRGKWDLEAVRRALGNNLDTRQVSPARGEAPPQTVGKRHSDPGFAMPRVPRSDTPVKGTIAHAELMHKQAMAAKAAMQAKELEGKLIEADDVRTSWSGMISRAKNVLLGIGSELCDKLAAEANAVRCREMIDERVRNALSELAEPMANAA
jgi:phage terminase Nu1 subunit (DNA packaging protein)